MDANVVGIGLTAAVGIAGIASTHLLARSQRKADDKRVESERRDRIRFREYEMRSVLYADFLAELRSIEIAARLRSTTMRSVHRKLVERATSALVEQGMEISDEQATRIESSLVDTVTDEGMPPPLDSAARIYKLTKLSSRIRLVATGEMAEAAQVAHSSAVQLLMALAADEILGHRPSEESLDFTPVGIAIAKSEEAALYDLRLLPHGEKASLDELRKLAREEIQDGVSPVSQG